jgi:hypothetical protein
MDNMICWEKMQQAGRYEHANLTSECCAVHEEEDVGIEIEIAIANGVGTEMGSNI